MRTTRRQTCFILRILNYSMWFLYQQPAHRTARMTFRTSHTNYSLSKFRTHLGLIWGKQRAMLSLCNSKPRRLLKYAMKRCCQCKRSRKEIICFPSIEYWIGGFFCYQIYWLRVFTENLLVKHSSLLRISSLDYQSVSRRNCTSILHLHPN